MRSWYQFIVRLCVRRGNGVFGFLSFCATMLVGIQAANAGCMSAPTARLRDLAQMSGRNPTEVVAMAIPATAGKVERAWSGAAKAEALDTLSRPAEARKIAQELLGSGLAQTSPVYIELLTRHAMNGFHAEEITQAIPQVQAARQMVAHGSAADVCLQIALGEMQRMRGMPERAVVYLADAYRATSVPAMQRQHHLAGEKLARVLDGAGDHLQAISLIEDVIDWDQAHGRLVSLSNDYYFRGVFNLNRGAFRDALSDFERSRSLAPVTTDPVGAAYLDLQTCATLIRLQSFARAKMICERADQAFVAHGDTARAQAQLYLARIAYVQEQPEKALALLDPLLASKDGLQSFALVPEAFRLRSDINRRLGRSERAYDDLKRYVSTSDQQHLSEQEQQSAVLRARFDTDRAAARNEDLQMKLRYAGVREREQAKQYAILVVSAAGGILLLLIIAVMGVYHRRKLVTLANTDPLTGLLNRRFVNENEKTLIETHAKTGAALTIAIVDIDHFKAVNDNHGHDAGDEVLIGFAEAIRGVVRKCDIVARWGGEEFIVIFPNASEHQAINALNRVREVLDSPIVTAAGAVRVRFSAGVASYAGIGNLQTLSQKADEALYRAKASGRDRIELALSPESGALEFGTASVTLGKAAVALAS